MQFSVKRQLTVALQNQPGRMAEISQIIATNGLNIEALCVVDNVEQGVIRLLVDEPARCKELLVENGFYVVEAEVLAIHLSDRRGKLAVVTKALATAQINIDYAYATVDHPKANTLLVMKVSSVRLAEKVLRKLDNQ
ncbi:MAG TPA: hypothetical protein VGA56_14270 [Opitutaceae bacterium]